MKKSVKLSLLSPILLFACAAMQAQVINILNEDWGDGVRTNQNLPNSAQWFSSTPADFSVQPGSITQSTLSGTAYVISYFTDGAPVALAQGQTLQVNYSYSLEGITSSGGLFRVGVFNSATSTHTTTRINGDTFGTNRNEFGGYTGYLVSTDNPSSGSLSLRKRVSTSTSTNLMSAFGSAPNNVYTTVGSSHTAWSGLSSDVIYNASFLITRNQNDTVTLTSILSDSNGEIYNVSREDSDAAYFSFDTFAMMLGGTSGDAFTLYSVDISVIPEASTYAWMGLGLVAGALAVLRRRRR